MRIILLRYNETIPIEKAEIPTVTETEMLKELPVIKDCVHVSSLNVNRKEDSLKRFFLMMKTSHLKKLKVLLCHDLWLKLDREHRDTAEKTQTIIDNIMSSMKPRRQLVTYSIIETVILNLPISD